MQFPLNSTKTIVICSIVVFTVSYIVRILKTNLPKVHLKDLAIKKFKSKDDAPLLDVVVLITGATSVCCPSTSFNYRFNLEMIGLRKRISVATIFHVRYSCPGVTLS